jgi:acetyl esterase/lipase
MKTLISILLMAITGFETFSQKTEIIYLWPGKVPGELKEKMAPVIDKSKKDNVIRYTEVTNPAIEIYKPDPSIKNRASVIVCPGGGYGILAYDLEGSEVASWLNRLGFTALVLQYRVPNKKEGALQDVQRAIRIVRNNASELGIDPDKTGVMGFSAGGSLSARASTLFNTKTYKPVDKADSLSCRPSFTMLIYPAYLDQGPNLTLTPELKLIKEVPPMYIFQTSDDTYGNSALVMTSALRNEKLPVELHFLPHGGHGYGLRKGNLAAETWPLLAEKWLGQILKDY